jgi:hypothetical protein
VAVNHKDQRPQGDIRATADADESDVKNSGLDTQIGEHLSGDSGHGEWRTCEHERIDVPIGKEREVAGRKACNRYGLAAQY